MAGKVAANPGTNVQVAAGLGLFFLESGSSNWIDLGALSDVSLETTTEFLEYSQNRRGSNALTRRFLQNKGFAVSATLEEVTPENLRLAFLGGTLGDSGATTYVRETATLTVQTDTSGDFVTLTENADEVDRVILSTSPAASTGLTLGAFTGPATRVDITDSSINTGDEVTVFYRVNVTGSGANARTFSIGANSIIEGMAQIRIRQQGGGIGRLIDIPDCEIAPNGTIDIAPDAVEGFPIILTARETNGAFGTAHLFDVSS